jgi:hypothetical protein
MMGGAEEAGRAFFDVESRIAWSNIMFCSDTQGAFPPRFRAEWAQADPSMWRMAVMSMGCMLSV